ncbi:MAG TPA: hypothetical protein VGH38_08020 [Bryobacteraceae bacterium]
MEGRFCAKCGSSVGSPPPGGPAPVNPGPPQYQQPMGVAAPMADNIASMLCYAVGFITGIIFLVIAPYNQNRVVRFHAFQSIFLSVGAILVSWIFGFIFGMAAVGLGSAAILVLVMMVIRLAFFLLWLYMLISAYQGKTVVLPVIGPLAQSQAGA